MKQMTANVGPLINEAVKGQAIKLIDMAHDIGTTLSALSNYKQGDRTMPADVAVKTADYLRDGKLNQAMAAKLFNSLRMYSTKLWQQEDRDNPFAIRVQQNKEERERKLLDTETFEDMLTNKSSEEIKQWVKEFLEEISVELLLTYSVCESCGIDFVTYVQQLNKEMEMK